MSPIARRDVAWVAITSFLLILLVLAFTTVLYFRDDISSLNALSLVALSSIALALLSLRER